MKKALIIIGIVVVIAGIGAGVYFGWKKSQEILSPVFDSKPSGQTVADGPKTKLKALSQNSVEGFWADANGSEIYYLSSDGKVMKVKDGNEETVSDSNSIGNVISAKFSNDGKFIIEQNSEVWRIFDLENKKWEILSTTISAADFSPDSKKIAFLQNNSNGNSDLITIDLSFLKKGAVNFFKNQKKILSLTQEDFKIKWLSDGKILLVSRPSVGVVSDVWIVDLKTKSISRFLSGAALAANWSKFGDLGVVFSIDGNSPRFSLFNSKGIRLADFGFYTFPQKCFIASQTNMFCAVPADQSAFNRVKFIDEYLKRGVFTKDNIVRLDLANNKTEVVFNSDKETIDAVKVSFNGSKFLFINRYDNRLYSLEL